jgi:hypothetical protein
VAARLIAGLLTLKNARTFSNMAAPSGTAHASMHAMQQLVSSVLISDL